MRVLLVHMRYSPDATGTAPLVTQLAEDLAWYGLEVSVVTSLPHYGRSSLHPDYTDFRGLVHTSHENGVEVHRTRVFVPKSGGLLPRAWNYLSFNINSVLAGLRIRNVDVVLAVNPPITNSYSAWLLSLIHRAALVTCIQDVWPDCIILVGQLKNRLVIYLSRILEKLQYAFSKQVIVLSKGMKRNLIGKGVRDSKITIIPNWADPEQVKPLSRPNAFSREHGLAGRFVVLFAGNHGYIAALEPVVQAARLLADDPEILFIFAGEGSVKADLLRLTGDLGLENVLFLPTQPKDRWLEMLAAADLGLVTLRKELAELNVPSKVYTLMSAGRPILASVPEGSEIRDLISEAKCGISIPPESPRDLADAVRSWKSQTRQLEQMGSSGRAFLEEHLQRQLRTGEYFKVLNAAA